MEEASMNKDAKANVVIEHLKKGKQLEDSMGGTVASSYLIMAYAVVSFSLFLHGERSVKGEKRRVCVLTIYYGTEHVV